MWRHWDVGAGKVAVDRGGFVERGRRDVLSYLAEIEMP